MDQNYWDKIYSEKSEKAVSWYQELPVKSLEMINELNLSKNASIIDVGGGDSRLVDHLLNQGFMNITVLDISKVSLEKLKARLGNVGERVKFINADVTTFNPRTQFDLWHDRATFHFLTELHEIEKYLEVVTKSLSQSGNLILSTFSKIGPDKCSGLPVHKYSDTELKQLFQKYFSNTKCFEDVHITPWGSPQSFVYCGFKKTTGLS